LQKPISVEHLEVEARALLDALGLRPSLWLLLENHSMRSRSSALIAFHRAHRGRAAASRSGSTG
jgi:hypothetical protein